jgi:hypothetical protein
MFEKLIKKLMGDMNVKAFGPMFAFLFCSLYFALEIAKMGFFEVLLLALAESIVIALIYAIVVPPTEAEQVKARARLARIEKFFGVK